jgi:hypothetical protein
MTAEECGSGFELVGISCLPILPEAPCDAGSYAIPGETSCHSVGECGPAPWGDLPDQATHFVDAAYPGTDSDGSAERPWTSIAAAITSAPPGAVVAIASGTYTGGVTINKPISLWGRCAAEVSVVSAGTGSAIEVIADGVELHRLGVTGADGVGIYAGEGVLVEDVWIHDVGDRGIDAGSAQGPVSVTVRRSLVENTQEAGISAVGADLTVEQSVVRGTGPYEGSWGIGVIAAESPTTISPLVVRASVLEDNVHSGAITIGSPLSIEGSVVRAPNVTTPAALRRGVSVSEGTLPGELEMTASAIQDCGSEGLSITASVAAIDTTTIRRIGAGPTGERGQGVVAQQNSFGGAVSLSMRASTITEVHTAGIVTLGAVADLERLYLADVWPRPSDLEWGRGITAEVDFDSGDPSQLSLRGSVIERSHAVGVLALGSVAAVEGTIVRDIIPREADGAFGRGISIQPSVDTPSTASGAIEACLVAGCHDAGIHSAGSVLDVTNSVVQDTQTRPVDGAYGDGIIANVLQQSASLNVDHVTVLGSARAGIATFGSVAAVSSTTIECNLIDLAAETQAEAAPDFRDLGGNLCGCGDQGACKALTSSLAPPEPL